MSNFLEYKEVQVVYKRYASLFFCFAIDREDNELNILEVIHRYVEILDKYFGSVCELDIIFNFEKAYFILDELILGGEIQETSKKCIMKQIELADTYQEEEIVEDIMTEKNKKKREKEGKLEDIKIEETVEEVAAKKIKFDWKENIRQILVKVLFFHSYFSTIILLILQPN